MKLSNKSCEYLFLIFHNENRKKYQWLKMKKKVEHAKIEHKIQKLKLQ